MFIIYPYIFMQASMYYTWNFESRNWKFPVRSALF